MSVNDKTVKYYHVSSRRCVVFEKLRHWVLFLFIAKKKCYLMFVCTL